MHSVVELGGPAARTLALQLGKPCLKALLARDHTRANLAAIRLVHSRSNRVRRHLDRRFLAVAKHSRELKLSLGMALLLQHLALQHALAPRTQRVL